MTVTFAFTIELTVRLHVHLQCDKDRDMERNGGRELAPLKCHQERSQTQSGARELVMKEMHHIVDLVIADNAKFVASGSSIRSVRSNRDIRSIHNCSRGTCSSSIRSNLSSSNRDIRIIVVDVRVVVAFVAILVVVIPHHFPHRRRS